MLWIVDVGAVVVNGRECPHQARHHGHGVGVAPEAAQKEMHLFIDHGVLSHQVRELMLLSGVG